jgi:hypothetical protein
MILKRIFGLPGLIILSVLATLAILIYGYVGEDTEKQPQPITALEKIGDECDSIAEKAAMHLPEVLPFQQLEKAGRRIRVLEVCMHDRAYTENPAWVKFAQPLAQKSAQIQHISDNEAYENLRRAAMLRFTTAKDEPLYWVKQQKQSK